MKPTYITTEETIVTKPEDFRTRFDKTFEKWHDSDNVLKPLVREFIEQEKQISHNLALSQVEKKYQSIFAWLLGEEGDFPESEPGKRYGFRSELRKRLAIITSLQKE